MFRRSSIKNWSLCLCLTLFVPGGSEAATAVGRGRVTSRVANVRADPSMQGTVLFQAKQGDELVILGEAGDWYHVQAASGWQGYVKKDLVEVTAGSPAAPAAAPAQTPPSPAAPAPAASVSQEAVGGGAPGIDHHPLDCILAENFPRLDARFDPPQVAKPRVYFRAGGTVFWYFVDMSPEAGAYAAILPKPKAAIKKIDYYVEAFGQNVVSGRTQEYAPAVVPTKADCASRMMASIATPAAKLVVGSAATGAPAVPEGFEAAGIGVATSAATAATAGAASTTVATASGGHTLLYVAGAVVVAGGVAVAAKGGGSSSSAPAAIDLTGTWVGPLSGQITDTGLGVTVTCQNGQTITMHIAQSGGSFTATATGANAHITCNFPGVNVPSQTIGTSGGGSSVSGTAANGQISFPVPNGTTFTGTYTNTTITTTYQGTLSEQGQTLTQNGTMTLTRQ